MLLATLRVGFLIAALAASLHVAAATRFWTLTRVSFVDSCCFEAVSGHFSYDDATNAVSSWNVRVEYFPFVYLPPFTYVPGNSTVSVSPPSGAAGPTVSFTATIDVPDQGWPAISGVRQLHIAPVATLDGTTAAVSLDTTLSHEAIPSLGPTRVRRFAGTLALAPPVPVVVARVDEFYNAALRHYFITADPAEKHALDAGVHPGWARTGESFKAYAKGGSTGDSIHPVCRYYSPPVIEYWDQGSEPGANSHFFSADATECVIVFREYSYSLWRLENDNAFQIALPDKTTGTCPGGTTPVYRLSNQRGDSNHRYTTSTVIRTQMLAASYIAEGYGPDGIAMCAVQ